MIKMFDAVEFAKNATFTLRHAVHYLQLCKNYLNFKNSEDMLEVGCADGKITKYVLYPLVEKYLGHFDATDFNKDAIEAAKLDNSIQNLHFSVLDVTDKELADTHQNKYDHIFAFYILHLIPVQIWPKTLCSMTKPGGQIVASIFLSPNFHTKIMISQMAEENKPWSQYLKNYEDIFHSHYGSDPIQTVTEHLTNAGLVVDFIDHMPQTAAFDSKEALAKTFSSANPLTKTMPRDIREEYENDICEKITEHLAPSTGQECLLKMETIVFVASKPYMFDAVEFAKNATFTLRHAVHYLQLCKNYLNFKNSEDMLEIGCADGKITKYVLYPLVEKYLGNFDATDFNKDAIEAAKLDNSIQNLHFSVLDVTDKELADTHQNKYDHIFAFYTLHLIPVEIWPKTLCSMTKPGGQIVASIFLSPNFHTKIMISQMAEENKPWSQYLKNYEDIFHSHYGSDPIQTVTEHLTNAGLVVDFIDHMPQTAAFDSKEALAKTFSSANPLTKTMPTDIREEYENDICEKITEHLVPSTGQECLLKMETIVFVASKPCNVQKDNK